MRGTEIVIAGALMLAVPSASAQSGDILSKAINTPSIGYNVYGADQATKVVKAKVQGGQAMQIDVRVKGKNPWDVGASAAIDKPIARGDRIVLAFWARAPKLAEGATTPISFAGITGKSAPYQQIIAGSVNVGREWRLEQVSGVAQAEAAGGAATVTMHLAAEKALLELGPVFVLDLGQVSPKPAS